MKRKIITAIAFNTVGTMIIVLGTTLPNRIAAIAPYQIAKRAAEQADLRHKEKIRRTKKWHKMQRTGKNHDMQLAWAAIVVFVSLALGTILFQATLIEKGLCIRTAEIKADQPLQKICE